MRFLGLMVLFSACDDGPRNHITPGTHHLPTTPPVDDDLDGYAVPADCDDADADVHPGADERCNTLDDDCDGQVDDNPVDGEPGFQDADGDGIGNAAQPRNGCGAAEEWSAVAGDCADLDATVHPGAAEVCNGKDDDCDLVTDDLVLLDGHGHDTIQEAIQAASDGSLLQLCDRTYVEGGIVVDRDVTIRSWSMDPALAVLDGSAAASPVFVVDGGDLTLEGFTVRWGTGLETVFDFPNVDLGIGLAGGAIHALTQAEDVVTVRSCTFEHNVGDAGGAIAAVHLFVEDSSFLQNTVTELSGWGGALWVGPGGELSVLRSLFQQNTAGTGGAIASYAPVALTDVEATDNHADLDGGFAFVSTTDDATVAVTLDLLGADIHDNTASDDGGALFLRGTTATADATTTFASNQASQDGGAVRIESAEPFPVAWDGGTFTNHHAERLGGTFSVASGDALMTISHVTVDGGTAGSDGGGAWISAGSGGVVVSDSAFTANSALGDGGGLLLFGGAGTDLTALLLERVELVDNLATLGGGAMLSATNVEIVDSEITNNGVSERGGALYVDDHTFLVVTASDVSGNTPNEVALEVGPASYTPAAFTSSFVCDGDAGLCF